MTSILFTFYCKNKAKPTKYPRDVYKFRTKFFLWFKTELISPKRCQISLISKKIFPEIPPSFGKKFAKYRPRPIRAVGRKQASRVTLQGGVVSLPFVIIPGAPEIKVIANYFLMLLRDKHKNYCCHFITLNKPSFHATTLTSLV